MTHPNPDRNILWERGRPRVCITINGQIHRKRCQTIEEARAIRDQIEADYGRADGTLTGSDWHKDAIISGVTADRPFEASRLWETAIEASRHVLEKQRRKRRQFIELPPEPVAIAFISDTHIGAPGVDYATMLSDAELVRDTPGMYAGFHGDGTDNWVIGKLNALQRGQAIGFDLERMIFEDWVNIIAEKLLWWVQGNHDDWSEKLVGSAPNRELLKEAMALYDRNQCILKLKHGARDRTVLVRHKWRFNSVFNPTHGLEVGWDRGDIDYDWAVGGHTHIATVCRPFYRHNKLRYAILTGTYKLVDGFGEEIGFPEPKGRGCGAMVLHPDGRQWWIEELREAAEFLGWLRTKEQRHDT